jgi:hypothetical protein
VTDHARTPSDADVKLATYRWFAEHACRPEADELAASTGSDPATIVAAWQRLRAQRVVVLDDDGKSIRMAPPFSGVPTQHVAEVDGRRYFANCAWDVLGIAAALHAPAMAHSRCEQSGAPLRLAIDWNAPEPCDWWFHCVVPAAQWWDDIVFT